MLTWTKLQGDQVVKALEIKVFQALVWDHNSPKLKAKTPQPLKLINQIAL